jgi:ABC-type tungstate transport system substrate-binding protein
MDQYCREPMSAAAIAVAVVVAYVYLRSKMNNEEKLKNSDYFKPAFLVGLLVYLIVSQGQGDSGPVLKEPF